MTDRQLFQKAVKNLPSLALPLFGTFLVREILRNTLPRTLFSAWLTGVEDIESIGLPGLLILALMGLLFLTAGLVMELIILGAFRLCLNRGEGKPGQMPWTILSQWRRYTGWVLWMGVVPALWKAGKLVLRTMLFYRLDYMEIARLYDWMAYYNAGMFLLSLILWMLLLLSVRTAYLRAPERGFWRAVGFGVKEGLQKWPRTIGAQLKFVLPVSLGVSLATLLLSKLSLQIGGPGISRVCSLTGRLLELMAQVWVAVLHGCLAAERYEGPEERT